MQTLRVIEVKISPRKSLMVIGYYRQWRLLDPANPYPTRHPRDKMARFGKFREIKDRVVKTKKPLIVGGDLNLDCYLPNNPYSRPNIQDTLPLLDALLEDLEITQLNWNPTR